MFDFQIIDFWDWFESNSSGLGPVTIDKSLLEEFDNTIINWGLTWEIGPGVNKKYSLTISPSGNKNLLEKTKYVIARLQCLLIGNFMTIIGTTRLFSGLQCERLVCS